MKKLLMLVLAFAVFPLVASAQTLVCKEVSEQKPDPDSDRQTLVNLEQGITHAIQINNSSVVNSVFSDDFSGVTWFGEVINKVAQIRSIQTSSNTYQFVRISNIQVKIYRDMATVSSLRTERGSALGHLFNRQFRVLRVYLNTPSGWRVVSQQETQLPS
ncbi:MAG TPA: nuclear transport factor 2 family protein [Candidatus Acidoferrum sp.]|nr:nuclear transport factor 2 family protein [Candidatus Acidoferrum sp.]